MPNTSPPSTVHTTSHTTSGDSSQKQAQTQVSGSSNKAPNPNSENKGGTGSRTEQSQTINQEQPYNLPQQQFENSQIAPGRIKPLPEEEILSWEAPSRPFKKKNKKYFTTVFVIGVLVALIFIFAGQGWLPAALTFSIVFLVYVLSTIPPQKVENKITTYGIRVDNGLYYWEELGRFWFEEKSGDEVLYIETARFPGRIALLIVDGLKEVLRELLSEVLLEQKPEPTPYEKVASWLQEKIPLDIEN